MTAMRALLERLIDYAGLFAPAELPMHQAVKEYQALCEGPHAWIAGRFIVPTSRLGELTNCIPAGAKLPISAIVDAGPDGRAWFGQAQERIAALAAARTQNQFVKIEAVEVAVPAPIAARETFDPAIGQFAMLGHNANLNDLPIYVELPRTPRFEELLPTAMFALARSRLGAKVRCGGLVQEAFPSSAQIVAFLCAAHEYDVPFKATAGLHHPIRGIDAHSGLLMHGFVNLLAAVVFVRQGAGAADLESILEERDPRAFRIEDEHFAWRDRSAGLSEIQAARAHAFASYGSCSFSEPIDDLVALGFLQAAAAPA